MRQVENKYIKITDDIKADLDWFKEFCRQWNGIAIIPESNPTISIVVDASLTGIGSSDGHKAYGVQVEKDHQIACNITELEALNILVALHIFANASYGGQHVRAISDNLASVQVMTTG